MGNQSRKNLSLVSSDGESAETLIRTAAAEVAVALGLIRVLTLLPLYDSALGEAEQHLATGWDSLLQLRRLLEADEVARCPSEGGDQP
jgi:hypothetical protein